MARLIVKSPYIKCGGDPNASGYLQYIATRERVEIVPDDRPPTRKQEQLIQKLVKDFPDTKELLEYDDYKSAPTMPKKRANGEGDVCERRLWRMKRAKRSGSRAAGGPERRPGAAMRQQNERWRVH